MPDAVLEAKLLLPRSRSRTVGRPRFDELLTANTLISFGFTIQTGIWTTLATIPIAT